MRYLTFALTKGRLAKKTMEYWSDLGLLAKKLKTKIPES